MKVPRSILYTPALDYSRVHTAIECDADVSLIDLEDSVPPDLKPCARELCVKFFSEVQTERCLAVRVNEMRSADYVEDAYCLRELKRTPEIVLLTMVRSAEEVAIARTQFSTWSKVPRIYVTVETMDCIDGLDAVAREADGMIFGAADFAAALGVDISWTNMLFARQRIAIAGARFSKVVIDSASFRLGNTQELEYECKGVKDLGFQGKAAVHPSQLGLINEIFRPSAQEIERARAVIEASRASRGRITTIEGQMIGPPFVKKAQKLISMIE